MALKVLGLTVKGCALKLSHLSVCPVFQDFCNNSPLGHSSKGGFGAVLRVDRMEWLCRD